MEDLTGRQFGPYRIVAPLGEGGMAAVYKAFQPSMERYVAIKVLPRHLAASPEFVARFNREAKLLAQLQHPNILQVFDYGEDEGYTYIVMPFVQSGTLGDAMQKQRFSLPEIRNIMVQLGRALSYAHAHGMIHRDIKPSNVLIDETRNCLLTDFGLARMTEVTSNLTASGSIMGTPAYMSPEQGAGENLDQRSDIYSLGIIMYELVTGRVPFSAETPLAIIFKHIQDPLPPPRSVNPSLSEDAERVLLKALAKNRDDRYQTADDFVRAVQKALPETEAAERTVLTDSPGMAAAALAGGSASAGSSPSAGRRSDAPPARTQGLPPVSEPRTGTVAPQARSGCLPVWLLAGGGVLVLAGIAVVLVVAFVAFNALNKRAVPPPPTSAPTSAPTAVIETPPPTATPMPIPTWTPIVAVLNRTLFTDDFSDTSSGWDQAETDTTSTDYYDGSYRILVNQTRYDAWANPGQSFAGDVIVEVDATKNSGTDDNDFGVICHYQDVGNFYYFHITSDGYAIIGKVTDGNQSGLSSENYETTDAVHQGDAANHIRGECLGNTLTLIVNGQQVLTATDTDHTGGDVGLMAGTFDTAGADILFDNFVVTEP
jgi:serine/threonine protein kinase